MASTKAYLDSDGQSINSLINWRHNPLTTVQRLTIGAQLTLSNIGYFVFDTDLLQGFYWTGLTWVNSGYVPPSPTVWGTIQGSLPDQADLNAALNGLSSAINTKLTKSANLSDLTDPATARTNLGVPVQFNPIQGANIVLSGIYPDITFTSSGGAAPATSFPMLSTLGILTNGSDQTAALNAIFANAAYKGVIVDFQNGGAITISGTVNAQGKVIVFRVGSTFTGSGTLSSATLSATNYQKLFDVSVNLASCKTADNRFSALWYGFVLNTADTTYSLQKSIDTCIANSIRTLFFPTGTYFINQPLMIYKWDGANYNQVSIRLEGETPFWQASGQGSTIRVNGYHSGFALGIQLGKGVEVKQLSFLGTFAPPVLTDEQFYNIPFASYTDGVCTDNTNAPFSGIVIEPFASSTSAGVFYPNITSYNGTINFYRGSGSGGSTGCIFEDLVINNFVIGFITSPTGLTSNAELMHLFKVQFTNNKCCIVGCQDQEKLNKVEHLACWGGHTIFGSGGGASVTGVSYGAVTPGHWVFDGMNLAGRVNRIIGRSGTGYFPMTIKHVFAESLGSIGIWLGSLGDSLEDSSIDFVDLGTWDQYPAFSIGNTSSSSHFNSQGVTIKNCQFRYYGRFLPLVFNGGIFEYCVFDITPYVGTSQQLSATFFRCTAAGALLGPSYDILGTYKQSACRLLSGGQRTRIVDYGNQIQGKNVMLQANNAQAAGFLTLDGLTGSNSTWTVAGSTVTVTPPTVGDLNRAKGGFLAFNMTTGQLMGVITAVGASTYTISYAPQGVVNGSGLIYVWAPLVPFAFMGTITQGSPVITNVVLDWGDFTDIMNYGHGVVSIPSFYGPVGIPGCAVILSINVGAATITMDRPAFRSATNYYFSSNNMTKEISISGYGDNSIFSGSGLANNEIMPQGMIWETDHPAESGRRRYIVKTTGLYNGSPQAVWCPLDQIC